MTSTALAIVTGPPSAAEWNAVVAQAETLALTQIVPKPFRGKPHDIVAVAMIGRELGLSPMMAMQYIHVIDGKPAMSAELMNARVRQRGHRITLMELTTESCTIEGQRADTNETQTVTFTMDDARRATLVKDGGNWTKVPKAMLWARCVSMLCRQLFPDVIAGASYVPEELGAEVDADGTPVAADDPSTPLPADLVAHVERPAEVDATDVEVLGEEDGHVAETYAAPGATPAAADGGFAQPTPPPPPTADEAHARAADDLFKYGWMFGSCKGGNPADSEAVDTGSLEWFVETYESRDPKYADLDGKRKAWCRAELERRKAADRDSLPAPEPMTAEQEFELQEVLARAGKTSEEIAKTVTAASEAAEKRPGVFARVMERALALPIPDGDSASAA